VPRVRALLRMIEDLERGQRAMSWANLRELDGI
jgi:hypothetical protein